MPLLSEDAARSILDGLREGDGNENETDDERDFCDECGQLCVPYASTPLNRLLCKECADAALAGPVVSPILTTIERAKLHAKAVAGTFDSLDFQAALDHAEEVSRQYEELIQRTNAANDQATIGYLHRDEKIHALATQIGALRATIAYCLSRVPKAMSATDALAEIARVAHSHEGPKS